MMVSKHLKFQTSGKKDPLLLSSSLSWIIISVLVLQVGLAHSSSLGASSLFPTSSSYSSVDIEDVSCNVNQLELANDSQLHSILHELRQTAFFRMFSVDLNEKCPVSFDQNKKIKEDDNHLHPEKKSSQNESTSDEEGCASNGLPDFDPDSGAACGVQTDAPSTSMFSAGGLSSNSMSSSSPETSFTSSFASFQNTFESSEDNDGEEFQCDGGGDEVDEDAPPLCSIDTSGDENEEEPFFQLSSSLTSISESKTWESASQKQTFTWSKPSDPVVLESSQSKENPECSDGGDAATLSDTFWMDMCDQISERKTQFINLALNPERNTGYNGTHIWNIIYEENCLNVDGSLNSPLCYEERVLYRLLSGLHTSTTLSIAKNYYPPSKRKNRTEWEANPSYFWDKFNTKKDHLDNLYFSYVVLLRALRKANPFLYNYKINTGNVIEDETATILLRRLLETHILQSCTSVFDAFDESLMFQETSVQAFSDNLFIGGNEVISLKQNFKDVFHNISSILDCVQCQQCKLHGKMAMLGYGTALKILFMPEELINEESITRNEIVAFINTIAKMSDATKEIRDLTHLYWLQNEKKPLEPSISISDTPTTSPTGNTNTPPPFSSESESNKIDLIDSAIGAISKLARSKQITEDQEVELVKLAFERDPYLLILTKHYAFDPQKFLHHLHNLDSSSKQVIENAKEPLPDAIVVGSGLAGLAATLNILDRNGTVVLVEKEHRIGGNSAKASSGINACCPHNNTYGDALQSFQKDTIKSAGNNVRLDLIDTLVGKSEKAVTWLKERAGVDLSLLAQLGGHQYKRTHRPKNGMAGAEIIYGMQKAVKEYEKSGNLKILMDTRVTELITNEEDRRVTGIKYQNLLNPKSDLNTVTELYSPNVILATGGFAADRSSGSYLEQFRPELVKMPATAGEFSTGDGIALATSLGAGTVDMDKVQIHPTGWVDPQDPKNPSKVLAAELMRGVGGILINDKGKRFCNELGTRAYVSDKMLDHDPYYFMEGKWNATREVPTFSLVLSSSAAEDGKKHVDLYNHKGLLTKLNGISALAEWMKIDVDILRNSLKAYQLSAKLGFDEWGKNTFRGVPDENLENETFYAGTVTPVLHYCMGGITIDTNGNVLDEDSNIISGLHAAGEVTGGVHGDNRLGGNSLLECTVYGTIVGQKIPIQDRNTHSSLEHKEINTKKENDAKNTPISVEELSRHDTPEDCWVAIHGIVYDLTDFAEEHPPGAESIHVLAGGDGTEAFQAVHNKGLLDDFEDVRMGILI